MNRLKGVGYLSPEDAIALGVTGPPLRASGVDLDLRRDMPYSSYEKFQFKVPISNGWRRLGALHRAPAGDARVGEDLPAGARRHARRAASSRTRPRSFCPIASR